ncbi:FxsC protein [Luedemannella helvata]
MPYFFLSHAPDEDAIFVERFYQDLSAEIRKRAIVDPHVDVGYLDIAAREGAHWPADAKAALAGCQTFIALCSAKYFLTSSCGRAWGVFADRLRKLESAGGQQPPALVPVIWSSEGLPEDFLAEEDIRLARQHTPGDEDLRVLLRLRRHRQAYRAFVASLAHRVIQTARVHRLPPASELNVDTLENAFERRSRWLHGAQRPQRLHFIVCAGTRQQMASIRSDLQYYGSRSEDWSPFPEASPQPLAAHAGSIAARYLLRSVVVPVNGLEDQISAARARNEIVVLLVDAWAVRLRAVRDALMSMGRGDEGYVAVLVPHSPDDRETATHWEALHRQVLDALPHTSQHRDGFCWEALGSLTDFEARLGCAIVEAQQQIHRRGRAFRTPGGKPTSRPIIDGP